MKLKILRDYLDFKEGQTYEIEHPSPAKYMIAMSIGKEVVGKGGKADKEVVGKSGKADKEVVPVVDSEAGKPEETEKVEGLKKDASDDILDLFND